MITETALTSFTIEGHENTPWKLHTSWKELEPALGILEFSLTAPEDLTPPELLFTWALPLLDAVDCWTTDHCGGAKLPPDWASPHRFTIANDIPELVFHNRAGCTTAAAAFSDTLHSMEFGAGLHEPDCSLIFKLRLFRSEQTPRSQYSAAIRIDCRPRYFADTVRDFTDWYNAFPEYRCTPVPEGAYEPLYSTWYSYHQDVHDHVILQECREAVKYGMKTVIVDDGWAYDNPKDSYRASGDWTPSASRFPELRELVRQVRELGMRYMLWFAVPFIGDKCRHYERLRPYFICERMNAGILDPRFPVVRRFIVDCCRDLMVKYGLDGLKLDFIDSFTVDCEDPALKEGMGQRDIRTIPAAVDVLMTEVSAALREVRPDALIEFRQCYIGPAIRKYGNMFRAADCPADHAGNRRRTINLRLTSGITAVHSDMLEWRSDSPVENAALQLLGVMFSVPQISVRLAELPEAHRRMLHFLLDFLVRHRKLLLQGHLHPCHPEHDYPLVYTSCGNERLAAVYAEGTAVDFAGQPEAEVTYVVNGTAQNEVILDLAPAPGTTALLRDCTGAEIPCAVPHRGITRFAMPPGSILKLTAP